MAADQSTRKRLYTGAGLMRQEVGLAVDYQVFNASYLARSEAEALGLMVDEMQSRCPHHTVCKAVVAVIPDEVVREVANG